MPSPKHLPALKRMGIAIILLLSSVQLHAQDNGHVGIRGGVSLPMGEYSAAYYKPEQSAMAWTGYMADVEIAYVIKNNMGIATCFKMFNNPINTKKYEERLMNNLYYYEKPHSVEVSKAYYANVNLGLGFYGRWPLNDKLSLDTKIMLGVLLSTTPDYTVTIKYASYEETYSSYPLSDNSLSFNWGFGLKYHLSDKVSMLVNWDYLYTSLTYVSSDGFNGSYYYGSNILRLGVTNLSAGIGFRL